MTQTFHPVAPPQLSELFVNFLNRSVDSEALDAEVAALGEVEPHEVAVGFRAEPKMAWLEGMEVVQLTAPKSSVPTAPPEWAGMVVRHSSLPALPFAAGNYPQRVRDLSALLQSKDLNNLRPQGEVTTDRPAAGSLRTWAAKQMQQGEIPARLAAIGILRSAQDYDLAAEYLQTLKKTARPEWQTAIGNEEAALLWQRGQTEAALALWNTLPETAVVLFNRGMAALFLNQTATAREALAKSVKALSEASAWHHLASLYLALAEMRK